MQVKSPYNFVPAPKEADVFKPDWADQVSHDIPFEDGESGEIEIKITAETPIFIRNGHAKGVEENEFCHFMDKNGKKQYYIPATSLKGMIRNVLEIMSQSRLNKNLVNNDRYAYRDLQSRQYLNNFSTKKTRCGWLYQDANGDWSIEDLGFPGRISHKEIDAFFQTKFVYNFERRIGNKLKPEQKIAKYKYEIFKAKLKHPFSQIGEDNGRKIFTKGGNKMGTLVFTGQAGLRNNQKNSGKKYEFIFFDKENPNQFKVSKNQKKDFKFIYLDHDSSNISKDWKYWKQRLLNGKRMPVFFTLDNNKLKHFGLAYLYKLPFKKSIHGVAPIKDYKDTKDLTETIFGYADKESKLKGRVYFSHAKPIGSINEMKEVSVLLASPKASYFPFYLEQNGNQFNTYDDNATLSGHKRYPVHDNATPNGTNNLNPDGQNSNNIKVTSKIKPLAIDSQFTFKIKFHNLKKIELGAILSALTFHGNEKRCHHALGAAKPLGYGRVQFDLQRISNPLTFQKEEYMYEFEQKMVTINPDWLSKTIHELNAISSLSSTSLVYSALKDFVANKKNKKSLNRYSTILKNEKHNQIKSPKSQAPYNFIPNYEFNTLKGLSKFLNESLNEDGIPEEYIEDYFSLIHDIFKNHKDSRKKLSKDFYTEYTWKTNMTKWLGKDRAKELYNMLNS